MASGWRSAALIATIIIFSACAGGPESDSRETIGATDTIDNSDTVPETADTDESVQEMPTGITDEIVDETGSEEEIPADFGTSEDATETVPPPEETSAELAQKPILTEQSITASPEVSATDAGPADEPPVVDDADADELPEIPTADVADSPAEKEADSPGGEVTDRQKDVPINPLLTDDRPVVITDSTADGTLDPGTPVPESVIKTRETEAPITQPAPNSAAPPESFSKPDTVPEPALSDAADSESSKALVDPEELAAAPSRWLGGPGEFSIVLDGQGWVFRSDLSTPGSWRFLSRERAGNGTRFNFLFEEPGSWSLIFERQDLSSGGSEQAVRIVRVGDEDGPVVENGPPVGDLTEAIPGTMPGDPDERAEAALLAARAGRPDEAMALWEKDAPRSDEAGRRARAALMEQAANTGAVIPLVTWLPRYLKDGADPDVLSSALDLLESQAGYSVQTRDILETLAGIDDDPRRPEWLYRLARRLEEPGEGRNMDRSAALYRQVVAQWPLTVWRDLSEERLIWLQRHYFRVR